VPVQGQLHADLHVKENILSEKSRNESMEVQVNKRVSLQSVLIVPVLEHQVQAHLKFGELFKFKSSKVLYKSK